MTTLAETDTKKIWREGGPGQASGPAQGRQMGSAQSVDEDHEARRGKASDLAVSSLGLRMLPPHPTKKKKKKITWRGWV